MSRHTQQERGRARALGHANVLGDDILGETVALHCDTRTQRKLCFVSDGDAAADQSVLDGMLWYKFRPIHLF